MRSDRIKESDSWRHLGQTNAKLFRQAAAQLKRGRRNGAAGPAAAVDDGPAGAREDCAREFSSVEHLSHEAVAAFVDDELADAAAHRARVHVVQCPECRREVHAQRGAAQLLRGANLSAQVRVPQELMTKLAGIANTPMQPGPDAEHTPCAKPEDFVDRVETLVRTFRRMHGHLPARKRP